MPQPKRAIRNPRVRRVYRENLYIKGIPLTPEKKAREVFERLLSTRKLTPKALQRAIEAGRMPWTIVQDPHDWVAKMGQTWLHRPDQTIRLRRVIESHAEPRLVYLQTIYPGEKTRLLIYIAPDATSIELERAFRNYFSKSESKQFDEALNGKGRHTDRIQRKKRS